MQFRLWLTFSFMFLPNLVCVSEVSDDIHQGIAACTSFVSFLRVAYLYMRLSFFSLRLVSFTALRCFERIRFSVLLYLYIFEGLFLFGSCEHSASAGFFGEPPFFV